MKNYYDILEINKKASKEIIENAYKTLTEKYSSNGYSQDENTDKLKDINEAYKILSDSFLKEQYDIELEKEQEKVENEAERKKEFKTRKKTKETSQQNGHIDNTYQVKQKNNVGSIFGIIDLVKELVHDIKLRKKDREEFNQKKVVSIILTIVIIVAIGLILWVIPFTNAWIRDFIFNNYFVRFISGLFS